MLSILIEISVASYRSIRPQQPPASSAFSYLCCWNRQATQETESRYNRRLQTSALLCSTSSSQHYRTPSNDRVVIASAIQILLSLMDKGREKGSIEGVRTLLNEWAQLLQCNQEILNETDRMLNEEHEADATCRTQFKEKWTLTPSEQLTGNFRFHIKHYRECIERESQVERTVGQTFKKQVRRIEKLSKDTGELRTAFLSDTVDGSKPFAPFLDEIISAYSDFTQLQNDLQKCTKVCNDLTQSLTKFQTKISDFCLARNIERDELMEALTVGSSSSLLNKKDVNTADIASDVDCVICFEQPIDSVLYKCGHMCMCYECALKQWKSTDGCNCPLCRTVICDVIRTYKS